MMVHWQFSKQTNREAAKELAGKIQEIKRMPAGAAGIRTETAFLRGKTFTLANNFAIL
jgi:hypothetical protein